MIFGTSYYPEITPESEWERDLLAMRECGLGIVRVLEFAWSAIEPREGVYDFDWVDRFFALAEKLGLQSVICTPTATPPAWLTTQYPDVLVTRRDGTRRVHGGRRDVDLDNEIYRHFCTQITRSLGQRYGRCESIVGWQIDNELIGPEGEPPESHSVATTFRFRQYLKQTHRDLATLNRRWGTRFWSQEYSDWGEITTPQNPRTTLGHVLDFSRYFSQSIADFVDSQARALRDVISQNQWISHNSTAIFDRGIDHVQLARSLDVAGWDAYPGAAGRPYPHVFASMAHDLFRTAKQKPFWVLETSPLRDNAPDAHYAQMFARGASAALMWHWREHPANAEYESDVFCDYAGRPDPSRVARLQRLTSRLCRMPTVARPARVAVMFCPDCARVGLTPDPYMQNAMRQRVSYSRVLVETYRTLWRRGIPTDVVQPDCDLDAYQLLVLPSARLLSNETCDRITRFVARGGTLLAVAKTAHQDQWATYTPSPAERLRDVLGFSIRRNLNLPADTLLGAKWDDQIIECLPHAERVYPETAQVLATFCDNMPALASAPAALVNRHGDGHCFYAAACSEGIIDRLLQQACGRSCTPYYEPIGPDVGLLPHDDGVSVWIFNFSESTVCVENESITSGGFAIVPRSLLTECLARESVRS